mgnify:CR=1 FL=1
MGIITSVVPDGGTKVGAAEGAEADACNHERELFAAIGRLRERGVAVLYVSHRLEEVFELADRATILRNGRLVEERMVADTSQLELVKLMIGRELEALEKKPVRLVFRLDPAIVGGLAIRRGNVVYDVSIEGNLERMKERIEQG